MRGLPVQPARPRLTVLRLSAVAFLWLSLGIGDAGGVPGPGPLTSEKVLYASWSRDRTHWTMAWPLVKGCDTPKLAWIRGHLYVYYVDRANPPFTRSEVLKDGSGGFKLGPPARVPIAGEIREGLTDPSVVRLPAGGFRLYYVSPQGRGDPALAVTWIRSALSADGIHWVRDRGRRLSGTGLVDPEAVVTPDGRYRLYYTAGRDFAAHSAISKDGLHFSTEPGRRVDGGVTSTIRLGSGTYLMVYQDLRQPPQLRSALSRDGLRFHPDPAFRSPSAPMRPKRAESPSIVRLPDGTWFMIYLLTP